MEREGDGGGCRDKMEEGKGTEHGGREVASSHALTHIPSYLASWTYGGRKHQVEVYGVGDGVPSHWSFHLVLPEQFCQLLLFVVINLEGVCVCVCVCVCV